MNLRNLCLFMCMLGLFAVAGSNGGCGGGGDGGGDTPVVEPQGNWQDEGNYDTGWYSDKPYEISTAAELGGLAKLVNAGNTFEGETISLMRDIDLGDHYWTPICNHRFTVSFRGTFDGRGNTISNMTILIKETHGTAEIGLAGTNDGTVANVRMTDISISGANDGLVWAGGLVGWNRGTVIDCTVGDSYISASGYLCSAGGLVGANGGESTGEMPGTITGCKVSNTTISASDPVSNTGADAGGLIGQIRPGGGMITDYVVSGGKVTVTSVNGRANSGGFAGRVVKGSLSGNTTTITELPAIGSDERLSPSGPSNDI
jgi:hypothetical protein